MSYTSTALQDFFIIKELESGESFGEMALRDNAPRTATIVASSDSVLAYLKKEDFSEILS